MPSKIYAVVDIYGKCVQVSLVQPSSEKPSIQCNITTHTNSIRSKSISGAPARPDKLRFHHKCGHLIKLSGSQRTAERRRPLDEFNNGVVVTHRPLLNNELFEVDS